MGGEGVNTVQHPTPPNHPLLIPLHMTLHHTVFGTAAYSCEFPRNGRGLAVTPRIHGSNSTNFHPSYWVIINQQRGWTERIREETRSPVFPLVLPSKTHSDKRDSDSCRGTEKCVRRQMQRGLTGGENKGETLHWPWPWWLYDSSAHYHACPWEQIFDLLAKSWHKNQCKLCINAPDDV